MDLFGGELPTILIRTFSRAWWIRFYHSRSRWSERVMLRNKLNKKTTHFQPNISYHRRASLQKTFSPLWVLSLPMRMSYGNQERCLVLFIMERNPISIYWIKHFLSIQSQTLSILTSGQVAWSMNLKLSPWLPRLLDWMTKKPLVSAAALHL